MTHDASSHGGLAQPKYRPDIDGLRAVAVLPVVAFHAFPQLLTGGFIGVDIFFVISGFLISTIIFENLERRTFSFADFYARRVRRIFPALSLVLVTTLVLGWLLLFTGEFRAVAKHVAAGSAFVANLALWQESGYFDAESFAKPLVHLWSLGVEEQFYIFWPLLAWAAWRLKGGIVVLLAIAAAASAWVMWDLRQHDPTGMFFSPLSRFWELLAGSALAWYAMRRRDVPAVGGSLPRHAASLLGIALLGGGFLFMSESLVFPGIWATIPVAGAVLLIWAGPGAIVNRHLLAHPVMVWFGLISYPLYLWHWPFLSYAWILYGAPPGLLKLALVVLSIVLAWATYRFVERPVRHARGMARVVPLAGLVAALCAAGIALHLGSFTSTRLGPHSSDQDAEAAASRAYNEAQQGESCRRLLGLDLLAQQYCVATQVEPQVMVLGDSHASALFSPVFDASLDIGGLLVGSNGCDLYPNLDLRRLNNSPHGLNCRNIANHALGVASRMDSVRTVVVAQAWPGIRRQKEPNVYLDGSRELDYFDALVEGGGALLAGLRSAGKEVVYLIDVPTFKVMPRSCERRLPDAMTRDCRLERAVLEAERRDYLAAITELRRRHPEVRFVDPTNLFCDASRCSAMRDGQLQYADEEHVNARGARRIWQLVEQARAGEAGLSLEPAS